MNLFKKIKLVNKGLNAYKNIKQIIKNNEEDAAELQDILNSLKTDFQRLAAKKPFLQDVYCDVSNELAKVIK